MSNSVHDCGEIVGGHLPCTRKLQMLQLTLSRYQQLSQQFFVGAYKLVALNQLLSCKWCHINLTRSTKLPYILWFTTKFCTTVKTPYKETASLVATCSETQRWLLLQQVSNLNVSNKAVLNRAIGSTYKAMKHDHEARMRIPLHYKHAWKDSHPSV